MTRARRIAMLAAAGVVGLLAVAGPAFAASPHDLGTDPVVDETTAGVDVAGIADAIDALESRAGISLGVVFVDDFGGADPIDWANATAVASGRTDSHDLLLAIAVGERGYGVSVDEGIGLSDAELSAAEDRDLLPRLTENDWPGAVIAYARAIGDLATGTDTGSAAIRVPTGSDAAGWILPVVGTGILVIVGAAFLVAWLRGRRRRGSTRGLG